MVKRLFAVGTGIAMLGATAMGALAADLSSYPDMFVTGGTFNGLFVVGESAQAIDNLAMTDIATQMKYAGSGASTTTTVSGDAWLVGTSSKFLEMANNDASSSSTQTSETFRNITTFIGDEELGALADGTFNTNENEYTFQQFLFFDEIATSVLDAQSRIVKYTEDDGDVTGDYFYIANGAQIARYKLEFGSAASSDVTDSSGTASTSGTYLDDFENRDISLMGKSYSLVMARRTSSLDDVYQNGMKLTLMAGATTDTLLEGESKTYTVAGVEYDVTLSYVDATNAKFIVNGESTNKLASGETYVLADKSEVGVSEVLYQAYAGGIHSATFFVGAQKIEMQDDNITGQAEGTYNLKVGSEDIDGTTVWIVGTDNNVTATINTIELNMSAEDDYFVSAGGKLSDVIAAAGEEKEVLFGNMFDIEYAGLTGEATHDLRLKTSSSRRYNLELYDGDGNSVDIPVAYANAAFNVTMAEAGDANALGSTKRLINHEEADGTADHDIYKNDYLILTAGTSSDGSAKSYLLQYKGADKQTKTSPKIKFKNLGNGESLDYAVTTLTTTGTVATIKLGGYSFIVQNATNMESDDFAVDVDLNGGGGAMAAAATNFVDYYGSEWVINYTAVNSPSDNTLEVTNESFVRIDGSFPNADRYDNYAPTSVVLNITATSGPELRAAFSGLTLLTPDGETEVSYGYDSMGAFYTFSEPASDPDELTIAYPENQRLPQVYITSGATTTAASASGNMVAVEVVDATKLDSEVASVSAQNLIVVGGPCVNSVAAELLGNPVDCTEGFTAGKARVKLFENANGNVAMLVAGYMGTDTRLAGKVIAHRSAELSGTEVEIEGTTYSDATIGAPTTVVEEVVVE